MRRGWRITLAGLAVVIGVPAAGAAVFLASFDPDALKPRIAEAVQRATGRELALDGPIRFRLAGLPLIAAEDVALANMQGGSRPEMLRVKELRVSLALLPLLSGQVAVNLTLMQPDLLLERDAAGQANWVMRPESPGARLPDATPPPPEPHRTPRLQLRQLRIEGGRLTWRDGVGPARTAEIRDLRATEASASAPLHLTADITAQGVPVHLTAQTGSLVAIRHGSAWPLAATVTALGASVKAEGTAGGAGGIDLRLDGSAPDLARLSPLAPGGRLPALRDVAFSAHLTGAGAPRLTAVSLRAGASDLSAEFPGLHLESLLLQGDVPDQPLQADLRASLDAAPIAFDGTLAPLQSLWPGAGPVTVNGSGQFGGAAFAVAGSVAAPLHASGKDLAVSLRVPDLAALSPRLRLPAFKDLALQARLGDAPDGVALRDLHLRLPQGELTGELVLRRAAGRPEVTGNLSAASLDGDALAAALRLPEPVPAPATPGPAGPAQATKPAARGPAPVIPDTPLHFARLRDADADLTLALGQLRAGGQAFQDVKLHLVLSGGKLVLNPLTMKAAGGPVAAVLLADASQEVPAVGLQLRAPALPAGPVLALLGLPPQDVTGTMQMDADLHGWGDSPRALAAGLDGRLGLAMTGGHIENRLLEPVLGTMLRATKLPELGGGGTDIRCFALRLDASKGLATVRGLALDTSRLQLDGTGTINLANETLALQLRPLLRMGGAGVAVPLSIAGPFRAPRAELARAGPQGRVEAVIGALAATAADNAGTDVCGPALAAARGGAAGPAPAPRTVQPMPANPRDLLRNLLR